MWPLNKLNKKSKKPSPRRGAKQARSLKRRRRLSLFIRGASLMVACFLVIGSIYIWKSGLLGEWVLETRDRVDRKIADAGFMVGEVRITGQDNTVLKQVRSALALYDGQSIISLDMTNMLDRVTSLPWVKAATITRILPDALEVTITEHQAAAVWQEDGRLYLVDRNGEVITDKGLEKFGKLPHVVGTGANKNLTSLLAMKARYPDIFARVKSAVWIGGRRWDLNMHNGVKIKLPEKEYDLAWQKLYDFESRRKILDKEILIIDLRQHARTILRLTPKEAERRRMMRKNARKEESI